MKSAPLFAALSLLAAAGAFAAEQPVVLKDAPGRANVENMCSGCHSLDYIRINAPFMNKQTWTAEVTKMIQAYGAPIPQDQTAPIVDYLTANYGVAQ
jgi:hypothetical protein